MPISFDEVAKFLNRWKGRHQRALLELEEKIIEGRDEHNVPVYSTKFRVKNANSIYLKSKRKPHYDTIDDVKDIAGIRVLCLFDQNIIEVFGYLIRSVFVETNSNIKECTIYNFSPEDVELFKEHNAWDQVSDFSVSNPKQFVVEKKQSSYKSIHFLIHLMDVHIEVQLRTLLQDVWGELEHAMAYKRGPVDLRTKETFVWLQDDLNNVGRMLSQFKESADREQTGEEFRNQIAGPYSFLEYEENVEPTVFGKDPDLIELVNNYQKKCLARRGTLVDIEHANKLKDKIKCIKDALYKKKLLDTSVDPNLTYWLDMEDAYILFSMGKKEDALEKYKEINKSYGDKRYVAHFRSGEIHFQNRDHIEALKCFDKAEAILNILRKGASKTQRYNHFLIVSKLALNDWMMGREYFSSALEHIKTAKKIAAKLEGYERFDERVKANLINNLCWYYLDSFLDKWDGESLDTTLLKLEERKINKVIEVKKLLDKSTEYYKELAKILNSDKASSNMLDTASWYQFTHYRINKYESEIANLFLQKGSEKYGRKKLSKLATKSSFAAICALKKSLKYTYKSMEAGNRAALRTASFATQKRHLENIADAAKREGITLLE